MRHRNCADAGAASTNGASLAEAMTAAPSAAVVSQSLAQKYWPNEDALGKRISLNRRDGKPVWREIVGVVKGVTHFGLETERYAEKTAVQQTHADVIAQMSANEEFDLGEGQHDFILPSGGFCLYKKASR